MNESNESNDNTKTSAEQLLIIRNELDAIRAKAAGALFGLLKAPDIPLSDLPETLERVIELEKSHETLHNQFLALVGRDPQEKTP